MDHNNSWLLVGKKTEWKNNQQNQKKKRNENELLVEEKNVKVRRETKPRNEEGYCNETSQSGQSTYSPDHQLRSWNKIIGVKQPMA